jgi:ABC-type multidrug transport system ATPase subunit
MKLHGISAYVEGKKTGYATWKQIRRKGLVFVPAESANAMNPSLSLDQNLKLLAPDSEELVGRRLREYFGMEFRDFAKNYPDEVSGGELQRITLMILLSRQGDLVFLDEPTVNLDRNLRVRFIEFLNNEVFAGKDKTVLMASHDIDFVRALKMDAIVELEKGTLVCREALPESKGYDKKESAQSTGSGIELSHVSQRYRVRGVFGEREFTAFKELSVRFDKSTIYGITGPSGCGKTSMIRAILRLIDGTGGSITLDGQNLVELKDRENGYDPSAFIPFRKKMTVVQQDSRFAFFPDLTIRESFSRINSRYGSKKEYDWASLETCMKKNGLSLSLLGVLPRSLSSGEMKRMDIVRALVSKPEVLLLDEPFAHIDFETRSLVMRSISEYLAENETVVIAVTHEDYDLKYFIEENYDFLTVAETGRPHPAF